MQILNAVAQAQAHWLRQTAALKLAGSTSPDVACTLRLRRISKRPCALTRAAWQPRISAAARAIGSLRDIQDVRRELSALEGLW